ncbi:hypothetical protein EDD11_009198 [Mortierella claussenii]|nr:hypothetical protein EDD11_009198 [Mortierella claussenii]
MPNMATTLPHFRDSFFAFTSPNDCSTYVAPLSASSLQAYNNMNASMNMHKRKTHDFDILLQDECEPHPSKRAMADTYLFPGTRQRQESGCSVSSTSSWSSSASFSTVCSSATVPDLMSASPTSRSLTASRSSSPSSESTVEGEEFNPLWHLCDAIALAEKQDTPFTSSTRRSTTTVLHKAKQVADDMPGLKIVFLEPNWLADHIAKSKKVVALKRQQQQQQQQQQRRR